MAGSKPEIGAKIVLDGAEEYQRSLKEVANAQKDLNKEMKLAESEFKATGDAQKLYNEKVRLLNAQMDNQKKKLETAQKALKELSDKGVNKNSDLWRKWNGVLLDSQTKMNNLQAELNDTKSRMEEAAKAVEENTEAVEKNAEAVQKTEQATQQAASATADYSGALSSIDKGVKFSNTISKLQMVKDAVVGVISSVFRMGKALISWELSGGDWAREIIMGAAKAGVSVEEYQARLYAQAVGGINTDAITEGVKKTVENLATTDTELLKLYNDLGISTRNADDTVRDATETFWDSVDALKGIEDQTTRSIYAQKLLGDQYLELRGLVDLGSEGYEKLIAEGKASATVTEESVKALTDMDAEIAKTEQAAQRLSHNVMAELAPGFADMANAFTTAIQTFDEFLQTEEGQQTIAQWNENLSNLADKIKDADLKKASEDLLTVMNGIASALSIAAEMIGIIAKDMQSLYNFFNPPVTPKETWEENKDKSLYQSLTNKSTLPGWEEISNFENVTSDTNSAKSNYGKTLEIMQKNGTTAAQTYTASMERSITNSQDELGTAFAGMLDAVSKKVDHAAALAGSASASAYVNAFLAQIAKANLTEAQQLGFMYGMSYSKNNLIDVTLKVSETALGKVTAPLVNAEMGAEIAAMR